MGISIFSTSSYSNGCKLPNPNPINFEVIQSYVGFNGFAIDVRYPDCTNYEGRKLLVFRGVTIKQLLAQGSIDPHFCDNTDYYSPFARFEPTLFGWDCAKELVDRLDI